MWDLPWSQRACPGFNQSPTLVCACWHHFLSSLSPSVDGWHHRLKTVEWGDMGVSLFFEGRWTNILEKERKNSSKASLGTVGTPKPLKSLVCIIGWWECGTSTDDMRHEPLPSSFTLANADADGAMFYSTTIRVYTSSDLSHQL